jgi:hypothetical protein
MTKTQALGLARERGSASTTVAGAIRYLRAHGIGRRRRPLDGWPLRRQTIPGRAYREAPRTAYRRLRVREAQEARALEMSRELSLWLHDEAEAEAARLTAPLLVEAERAILDAWPYRRAASRWAGGQHSVTVRLADGSRGSASCSSERVWSDNRKWSGTDSGASIALPLPLLLAGPSRYLAGGLLHTAWAQLGQREAWATWYVQGRGVELRPQTGYVIRGHHVPAKRQSPAALARALRIAAEARGKTLVARLAARLERRDLRRVWVAVEDSIRGGNCPTGTEQGAAAIWRQIGADGPCAIRADVLVGLRDDAYARRAIAAAIARG